MKRESFIVVLESIDGGGKKTQSKFIVDWYRNCGRDVIVIDFPQYETSSVGELISECLKGNHGDFMNLDPKIKATLYAADRMVNKDEIIRLLELGYVIIFDRYVSSNQIHQAAHFKELAESIKMITWVHDLEYVDNGMPHPDIVIYLDLPIEIAQKLCAERGNMDVAESDIAHQKRARAIGNYMCDTYPELWHKIECVSENNDMLSREHIFHSFLTY